MDPADNQTPSDQGIATAATPPELALPPQDTQSNADPAPVTSGAPQGAAPSGPVAEVAAVPPSAAATSSPKTKAKTEEALKKQRAATLARVQRFREKKKAEGAAKPAEEKPAAPASPELTKKQEDALERDVRALLDAMWLCGQIVAGIFRRELLDLDEKELGDGVRAWMPVARKHPWLVTFFRWLTAPLWLVQMIRRKLRRRAEQKEAAKKPAELVEPPLPPPQAPASAQRNGPGNVVTLPPRRSAAALAAAEDEERRKREEQGQ